MKAKEDCRGEIPGSFLFGVNGRNHYEKVNKCKVR